VTARRVAMALVGVCAVYLLLAGQRGVELVRLGTPLGVALGVSVVVVPLVVAYLIYREVRFGLAVQELGRSLAASGGLPVDDLPRRPSGRVDPVAADEAFARRRLEVQAAPDDPGAWFRLGVAYDDARDRKRAREAMRRAVALYAER
jgi:cytochrome c-type biogenesis protein CcmH/NrfG